MTAEELAKRIDQPLHVVERALAALEAKGLVQTISTAGKTVSTPPATH